MRIVNANKWEVSAKAFSGHGPVHFRARQRRATRHFLHGTHLPKAEMHVVPARGTDIVLDAVKTPLVHSVAKNARNTIRNLSGHAGNYRTALSPFMVGRSCLPCIEVIHKEP